MVTGSCWVTLVSIVLINKALADSFCLDDPLSFTAANATGSISIDGLGPVNTNTGTWNISMGVYHSPNITDNQSHSWESFWIETDTVQNLSSPDLPYSGCLSTFQLNNPAKSSGTDRNGCNGVLPDACLNALQDAVSSVASALNGTYTPPSLNDSSTDECTTSLVAAMKSLQAPGPCEGYWDTILGQGFIFGGGFPSTDDTNATCDANLGSNSGSSDLIATFGLGGRDGRTIYDELVKGSTPLMLIAYSKNEPGWADSMVVCVTPNHIAAGSSSAGVGFGEMYSKAWWAGVGTFVVSSLALA